MYGVNQDSGISEKLHSRVGVNERRATLSPEWLALSWLPVLGGILKCLLIGVLLGAGQVWHWNLGTQLVR